MLIDINYSGIKLAWARSNINTNFLCNLGDSLSPIITSALFNLPVLHSDFDNIESSFVCIGSIGHEIKKESAIYWGVGVPNNIFNSSFINKYEFLALRGPISEKNILLPNKKIPYGDPATLINRLLPQFFPINLNKNKKILIIPHIYNCHINIKYRSKNKFLNSLKILDLEIMNTWSKSNFDEIHKKIQNINNTKIIISNSFHAHVLGVLFGAKAFLLIFSDIKEYEIKNINLLEDDSIDWRFRDFYIGQNYKTLPALLVNPDYILKDKELILKSLEEWDYEFSKFSTDKIMNCFINRFKDEYDLTHLYDTNLINIGNLNRITY